jgi:hypothetical protein
MLVLDFTATCEILTPPQESDVGMAPTKGMFDALTTRVSKIEETLAITPAPPKDTIRQKISKTWAKISSHPGISIIFAAIFCLVSVFGGGYFKYWLDHRHDWINEAIETKFSAKGGINEKLANLQATANSADTTLKALAPFIQDVVRHQFESASNLSPQSLATKLPAVNNLLTVAKNQAVNIPPALVSKIGTGLVGAVKFNPDAWNAALSFLVYKSENFDKATLPVPPPTDNTEPTKTVYAVNTIPGKEAPKLGVSGRTDSKNAANISFIGKRLNDNLPVGAAYIWMSDGNVALDNTELKNVVMTRVHVYYSGGPVQLQNVYFVDCIFEMKPNKNSQSFMIAALKSSPFISFSAAS